MRPYSVTRMFEVMVVVIIEEMVLIFPSENLTLKSFPSENILLQFEKEALK